MCAFVWIIILTSHQNSKAKSGTSKIMTLVASGIELDDADDIVFGQSNSRQKNRATRLLSGDVIDRKSIYDEAMVLALIPAKNEAICKY